MIFAVPFFCSLLLPTPHCQLSTASDYRLLLLACCLPRGWRGGHYRYDLCAAAGGRLSCYYIRSPLAFTQITRTNGATEFGLLPSSVQSA